MLEIAQSNVKNIHLTFSPKNFRSRNNICQQHKFSKGANYLISSCFLSFNFHLQLGFIFSFCDIWHHFQTNDTYYPFKKRSFQYIRPKRNLNTFQMIIILKEQASDGSHQIFPFSLVWSLLFCRDLLIIPQVNKYLSEITASKT